MEDWALLEMTDAYTLSLENSVHPSVLIFTTFFFLVIITSPLPILKFYTKLHYTQDHMSSATAESMSWLS